MFVRTFLRCDGGVGLYLFQGMVEEQRELFWRVRILLVTRPLRGCETFFAAFLRSGIESLLMLRGIAAPSVGPLDILSPLSLRQWDGCLGRADNRSVRPPKCDHLWYLILACFSRKIGS